MGDKKCCIQLSETEKMSSLYENIFLFFSEF